MDDYWFDISKRARKLNHYSINLIGPVAYWMSREQRVNNNWALLFAQQLAQHNNRPLIVIFSLDINYPDISLRSFDFLIKGLMDVEQKLAELNIPFYLIEDKPISGIVNFILKNGISILVTDFDPLKIKRYWKTEIVNNLNIPFYEVDAHNIVPCWVASQKTEFGAYTLRPKIKKLLPEYLTDFPNVKPQHRTFTSVEKIRWDFILTSLVQNTEVLPVKWIKPNQSEALHTLEYFIENKLEWYNEKRNDPNADATSHLSPYLHFGHISAQFIAMKVIKSDHPEEIKKAFLEELIIRRELSDNFCQYNPYYDSFLGFPTWAQKTLNEHRDDKRYYLYTPEKFEKAETHDELWNAAQKELLYMGKMHGYMRMYWAKKILEWSQSPEEAIYIANFLNNKYALDGRDPNGYAGCAWSIGGVHDRAWNTRNIFGKIRYMNENGCRRKFDTQKYCSSQKYLKTD